jgi:hypothetical protein
MTISEFVEMCLSGSKTNQGFVREAQALASVLKGHGFEVNFRRWEKGFPIVLFFSKGGRTAVLGPPPAGSTDIPGPRDGLSVSVFRVHGWPLNFPGACGLITNRLRAVVRRLVVWGLLDQEEVKEHELVKMDNARVARCSRCQKREEKQCFIQCVHCQQDDAARFLPTGRGLYCGDACQNQDWCEHRRKFHAGKRLAK